MLLVAAIFGVSTIFPTVAFAGSDAPVKISGKDAAKAASLANERVVQQITAMH